MSQSTPLAIVGLSAIFPQADDLRAYWRNLKAGTDAITAIAKLPAMNAAFRDEDGKPAVETETGERPVLFLDDPFSALDPARQRRISGRLAGRGQVFVSVADEAYVPAEAARTWSVAAGAVVERGAA